MKINEQTEWQRNLFFQNHYIPFFSFMFCTNQPFMLTCTHAQKRSNAHLNRRKVEHWNCTFILSFYPFYWIVLVREFLLFLSFFALLDVHRCVTNAWEVQNFRIFWFWQRSSNHLKKKTHIRIDNDSKNNICQVKFTCFCFKHFIPISLTSTYCLHLNYMMNSWIGKNDLFPQKLNLLIEWFLLCW